MFDNLIKDVRRSMSQITARIDRATVEVTKLGKHMENIDKSYIKYDTKTIQVTPLIVQGWLRKKTETANLVGVDTYPVRYL